MQNRRSAGRPWCENLLWYTALLVVCVVPLLVVPSADDSFRMPKTALLRSAGLLLGGLAAIAAMWRLLPISFRERTDWMLPLAIAVWTGIATIFSSDPFASTYPLVSVIACCSFYVVTFLTAGNRPVLAAAVVLPPALINLGFFVLQRYGWNPFLPQGDLSAYDRIMVATLSESSLLGNRDDVGVFLVLPCLVSLLLAFVSTRRARAVFLTIGVILGAGVVVTKVLTAIVALFLAVVATAFARSIRTGLLATSTVAVAILIGSFAVPGLRAELGTKLGTLASEKGGSRTLTTLSALSMFADDPVTGIGPERFGWGFYPKKIHYQLAYKDKLLFESQNFGEVHNDHAQMLAEAGLPAYLLFLAAIAAMLGKDGIAVWRRNDREGQRRSSFASLIRMPFTISLFVLMLGQFPLQLAAPIVNYLFVGAISRRWRHVE